MFRNGSVVRVLWDVRKSIDEIASKADEVEVSVEGTPFCVSVFQPGQLHNSFGVNFSDRFVMR